MTLKLANEDGTAVNLSRQPQRVGAVYLSPDGVELPQYGYRVSVADAVKDPHLALAFAQLFMQVDANVKLTALTAAIESLARAVSLVVQRPAPPAGTSLFPPPEQITQHITSVLSSLRQLGVPVPAFGEPQPPAPATNPAQEGG